MAGKEIQLNERVEVPSRRLPVSEWPSGKTYTVPRSGYVHAIRQYRLREPRYFIRTDDGHRAWYDRYDFRPLDTRVRRVARAEINLARGLDEQGIPLEPLRRARFLEAEGNGQYMSSMDEEEREFFVSLMDEHFCISAENRKVWRAFKEPRDAQRQRETYENYGMV